MPKIECEICHKLINEENKDFLIENKCFYHKKCYILKLKQEKKEIFLPKLKNFTIYFIISLVALIIFSFFQDPTNLLLMFICYITMVLTISFGIMILIVIIKFKSLKY